MAVYERIYTGEAVEGESVVDPVHQLVHELTVRLITIEAGYTGFDIWLAAGDGILDNCLGIVKEVKNRISDGLHLHLFLLLYLAGSLVCLLEHPEDIQQVLAQEMRQNLHIHCDDCVGGDLENSEVVGAEQVAATKQEYGYELTVPAHNRHWPGVHHK